MKKTLAVYIVTYNRARYLGDSIKSILNQTFKDFTLTILDNCSTDNTKEVVESFKDERIRYIRHKKNIGGIENLTYALNNCKADFISIFHDDDMMLEDMLQVQYDYLSSHEECDAICGRAKLFTDNNIEYPKDNNDNEITRWKDKKLIKEFYTTQSNLVFPTFMYRMSFLKEHNLLNFRTDAGPSADVVFYCEIERCGGEIVELHRVLQMLRIHGDQWSNKASSMMYIMLCKWFMNEPYYKDILEDKKYRICLMNKFTEIARHDYLLSKINKKDTKENLNNLLNILKLDKKDINNKKRMVLDVILINQDIFSNLYKVYSKARGIE